MAQIPATRRNGGGLATRREHPLDRLRGDFDTLFDRLWSGWLAPYDQDLRNIRVWDFDVKENDQEIVVRAEIPGFKEDELDVQLNNDVLTIKAEKEQKGDGQEEYRSFFRTVMLPAGVNPDKVQATYQNGVLELHCPRAEGAQTKRIKVHAQQGETGQQGRQPNAQAGGAASEKSKK
jgi:HSP20 family protein